MKGRRAVVLGLLTWLAVVSVGAVLVWVVISRAGAGLVAGAGPVPMPTSPAGLSQRATWQGEAGEVTAACSGTAVTLVAAQPEDGVTVHVLEKGPARLVVAFDTGGSARGAVRVEAVCRDGRPSFGSGQSSTSTTDTPSASPPASPSGSPPGDGDPTGDGESDGAR